VSDLLDRLVDRALGRAAVVRPLIASRFEPDGRGAGELSPALAEASGGAPSPLSVPIDEVEAAPAAAAASSASSPPPPASGRRADEHDMSEPGRERLRRASDVGKRAVSRLSLDESGVDGSAEHEVARSVSPEKARSAPPEAARSAPTTQSRGRAEDRARLDLVAEASSPRFERDISRSDAALGAGRGPERRHQEPAPFVGLSSEPGASVASEAAAQLVQRVTSQRTLNPADAPPLPGAARLGEPLARPSKEPTALARRVEEQAPAGRSVETPALARAETPANLPPRAPLPPAALTAAHGPLVRLAETARATAEAASARSTADARTPLDRASGAPPERLEASPGPAIERAPAAGSVSPAWAPLIAPTRKEPPRSEASREALEGPGTAERAPAAPAAPPGLPAIRVSIGRIEVRAVAPPAQARPPAERPRPPLSLGDYLKQQRGRS
jgi:hypothetical protein